MRQVIFLILLGAFTQLHSQTNPEYAAQCNLQNGIAINGYDPVAYFTKNKAEKGNATQVAKFEGIYYHFSSVTNKETFLKNPKKYQPQYGGWCAFAMGDYGKKVEVDPETFKIVDGKLYLFYNAYFNNTLKSWNKDEKNLKLKADKNWATFLLKN
jgi:YHS domain-containing protein